MAVNYGALSRTSGELDNDGSFFQECPAGSTADGCISYTDCKIVNVNGTVEPLSMKTLRPNKGLINALASVATFGSLIFVGCLGQVVLLCTPMIPRGPATRYRLAAWLHAGHCRLLRPC